jgi:hypothetical protein
MTRRNAVRIAVVVLLAAGLFFGLVRAFEPGSLPAQLWSATPSTPMQTVAMEQTPDGKLTLTESTARTYGYRIGDPIDVRLTIDAKPGATVNFETLEQESITRWVTDFTMFQAPVITHATVHGDTIWTVDMVVAFWVPNPQPFQAEFLAIEGYLGDGQPNWQYVDTPPIQFTWSPTAPAGAKNLDPGSMSNAPSGIPAEGLLLLILGSLAFAITPATVFAVWWRRRHAPKLPTEMARFWSVYRQCQTEAQDDGWQTAHYRRVATAFRQYIQHTVETTPELDATLTGHPQHAEILSAQRKLDRSIYGKEPLSKDEQKALAAELELVIPQHLPPAKRRGPLGFVLRLFLRAEKRVVSIGRWIVS